MSGWAFAWDNPAGEDGASSRTTRLGAWGLLVVGVSFALWLFAYGTGLYTTLGAVDGSERHDRNVIRLADESSFGLSTMYVLAGQRLWWDYDVAVEGRGGVRLRVAKSIPSAAFIVRFHDVAATARGRFEVVAPESGLYSFSQEPIPQGVLLGGGEAGATRYDLSWGVD